MRNYFLSLKKEEDNVKKCKYNKGKCIHDKQKRYCRECGGSSICEHNREKFKCKECKGTCICEHNKIRSKCRECGGASICEHNRERSKCRDCGGGSICEHNRARSNCRDCGGASFCEHNRFRNSCKECKGSTICEHNNYKNRCIECRGCSICEHNKVKIQCKECRGSQICEHNKQKHVCVICNPSCSCQECKSILTNKRSYSYPLCQACFCNKYPDHERSTLYKIKERYLRDELRERFPNNDINMIFDKAVDGGCSNKRPDVLIDLLTHSIIIECDEHQHKNYTCENKRTMQLFEDLGNRPLVMIRFNPDNYIDENGNKVEGCFKPLTEVQDMHKKRFYNINETEWNRRICVLEKVIKEYIGLDTFPSKEITEIKLFYMKKLK